MDRWQGLNILYYLLRDCVVKFWTRGKDYSWYGELWVSMHGLTFGPPTELRYGPVMRPNTIPCLQRYLWFGQEIQSSESWAWANEANYLKAACSSHALPSGENSQQWFTVLKSQNNYPKSEKSQGTPCYLYDFGLGYTAGSLPSS
jgi:hypothetical protein